MSQSNLAIAKEVAHKVRAWTERKRYIGHNMQGLCAIASAELARRLQAKNIAYELHLSQADPSGDHVYVVVDDTVVDVTATQFPQFADKPVVVLHTKEAEAYMCYQTTEVFTSASQLSKFQIKEGWPKGQIAYA